MQNQQVTVSLISDIPEVAAYLARISTPEQRAEARSPKEAVVFTEHGNYWRERVHIRLDPMTGEITTWDSHTRKPSPDHAPTKEEAEAIRTVLRFFRFPVSVRVQHYDLPIELRGVDDQNIYRFKDEHGALVCLVVRHEAREGGKTYRPWTLFDDGVWRNVKPDGLWTLYNLEKLKQHTSVVFLHEGPKTARFMDELTHPQTEAQHIALAEHPWREEICAGVHLGWHGGALNPHYTDWSTIRNAGVKTVFIIEDNDEAGREATPKIAQQLKGMTVYKIRWGDEWPTSFDMADEWPNKLFKISKSTGGKFYAGKTFTEMLTPATWATDLRPYMDGKKTKFMPVLRDEFVNQWRWCSYPERYVNVLLPALSYGQTNFDRAVKSFSHVDDTSRLLVSDTRSEARNIVYRPDVLAREIAPLSVNVYNPPQIKPRDGDPSPWLEFLKYLIPNEKERYQTMRWLATLIAKPETRMVYSLLLISERHGVGKTTLSEKILIPLVGEDNASTPREDDFIESQFNGWAIRKRLVIADEVYSGKSRKAYNKLKKLISDKFFQVNEKYEKGYMMQNWVHVVLCSNSKNALKIDEGDRRWFYPELTETPWDRDEFVEFHGWLEADGINIILHWARNLFTDYVIEGEEAPMTKSKEEMIYDSISEPIKLLRDWGEGNADKRMIVWDRAIKNWLLVDMRMDEARWITPVKLRGELKKLGWVSPDMRLQINGVPQFLVMSPPVAREWEQIRDKLVDQQRRDWLRERLTAVVDNSNPTR